MSRGTVASRIKCRGGKGEKDDARRNKSMRTAMKGLR